MWLNPALQEHNCACSAPTWLPPAGASSSGEDEHFANQEDADYGATTLLPTFDSEHQHRWNTDRVRCGVEVKRRLLDLHATIESWTLTDEQRTGIVRSADSRLGTPYSAMDYAALVAHRLHIPVPGLRGYIGSTGHMICSQFADWCYSQNGLRMFDDGRWCGYVTPGMLRLVLTGPLR